MRRLIFLILAFSSAAFAQSQTEVRIGWQIPWATQGQIVQILKRTDILKKNGIKANFVGRTYGPMLNELAMGDGIDVVLTGDLPGLALISKGAGWRAIGRLMYNRTVTYVPAASPIKDLKELRGKSIALPMGAAAERVTKEAMVQAGLDPAKDVKIVNLDIREQGPLVMKSKGKPTFDQFDGLAGFDPLPAIFETQGSIRPLHVGKVVSLVIMKDSFLSKNPQIGKQMMQAIFDAYDYYRQNAKQANDWFLEEAQLNGGNQKACEIAAGLEPNLKAGARSAIRVSFTDEDLKNLESAAAFLADKTGQKVKVASAIDNTYVKDVK